MIIKTLTSSTPGEYINREPDHFVSDKEKQGEEWIKYTVDYYETVALSQHSNNKDKYLRNYRFLKGELEPADFYEDQEINTLTDNMVADLELPKYVQPYLIMDPPINTLLGEMSSRPDNVIARAFDDESKQEQLAYMTSILDSLLLETIQQQVMSSIGEQEIDEEQFNMMVQEKMQEYSAPYTTKGERWAEKVLEMTKVLFSMKEKSEEGFRDLLTVAREFYHIYEDNSETGFNIETLNPINTWFLTSPNEKYTSDPLNDVRGAYAAGTINIMEFSEIIHRFTLTKEEIEILRKESEREYLPTDYNSNLFQSRTGDSSIDYHPYSRALQHERLKHQAEMNYDPNKEYDEVFNKNISSYGSKFLVLQGYTKSKKKIGKLTYINQDGQPVVDYVDENYKNKTHPNQISLEWGYVSQWYKFTKIGPYVYFLEPFELLPYCPVIGCIYEPKNSPAKSLVDLMKPFQMLATIFYNKAFESLQKDLGKALMIPLRHIPTPKDASEQDAMEIFISRIQEQGLAVIDESPENAKMASQFNQYKVHDMSRVDEMQAYLNLAIQVKRECWELVGITPERLGSSQGATQTATSINASISQSYSQTEPWFVQHENVINKTYQAIVDAAQYIESHKPESTIRFLNDEGDTQFLRITQDDLLRNILIFVTSRGEDIRALKDLRQLSQAALQNGASLLEVSELFTSKSMRHIKTIFKQLKERQEDLQNSQQQVQQQQLEQQQQLAQAQMQQDEQHHQENLRLEVYKAELKANTDIAKAEIQTYFQAPTTDSDGDGTPDISEISANALKAQELLHKRDIENQKIAGEMNKLLTEQKEREKDRELERAQMKNDEIIARINLKGRQQKKSSPKKK